MGGFAQAFPDSGRMGSEMRRPRLSRWLKKEVMHLAGLESFSLRKAAAVAQDGCPRAAAPLLLFALCSGRTERLLDYVWRDDVRVSFEAVATMLEGKDIESIAIAGGRIEELPREYAKHLDSYHACYHASETKAESKKLRWERSRMLLLQKGVPVAQISRDLGLNQGNLNAYLKHGDVSKLSLANADAVMRYLVTA